MPGQGQPSRAHLPGLCAGHARACQRGPGKAFPLDLGAWRGSLARGPRSALLDRPNTWPPLWLLLPPLVPGNRRAPTWASSGRGWSGCPTDPRLPSLPLESTELWEPASSPPATNPGPVSMAAHTQHLQLPGGPGLQPPERTCLQQRPQSCWAAGWGVGTRAPPGHGEQPTLEAKHLRDCGRSLQALGSMAWEGRGGRFLLDGEDGKGTSGLLSWALISFLKWLKPPLHTKRLPTLHFTHRTA